MSKIKIDKAKKQVIFQCKTEGEMKYVLDLYGKGAKVTSEEASKSIGIPPNVTKETTVKEKVWGPDDTYLVAEVQVGTHEGFNKGDRVKVTVEKLEEKIR